MKLLVCVLNETRRLNDLLKAMAELGISGATVLESQGMAGVLGKESPVVAGLRHLVTQGRTFNYTILSVVEDDQLADRTMKAIEDHLLPGTKGGTRGVAFTLPVDKFVHFQPHGQEVLKGKQPPEPSTTSDSSSFERAMLAALKRAETAPPKLVSKLADGLKALVEPKAPAALREKRRAPRVTCDYQVKASCEGESTAGTLADIGLFGLSFVSPIKLAVGSRWKLEPPDSVAEDAPATVTCKVEQCSEEEGQFRCGLAYDQSAEALTQSWIAHLLRALGYSMGQMVQRRKLRRVPAQVKAEFQSQDGEVSVSATILDLGIRGALVEADVAWEPGTEVGLLVGPHDNHEAFYLEGVTVDARAAEESETWMHGVRFYPADSVRLDRLGKLVIDLVKRPATQSS